MVRSRVLTIVAMALAGLGVLAAPSSAEPSRRVATYLDIPYAAAQPAGSRGHLLDLYVPVRRHRQRPLLVVMGGSGWYSDDGKAYAKELAPRFTAAGYVVAGVSTRSSSQAVFPAQVHDVKAAIRWLRAHAAAFGVDRRRIAVMGDSSGGWTALMAGLNRSFEGTVGVTGHPSDVQAVVDLYAPIDFAPMTSQMPPGACASFNRSFGLTRCHDDPRSPESALLGCPIRTCLGKAREANPIAYGTSQSPPVLIVHGALDALVPLHQSEELFEALAARCAPVTLYAVPDAGHDKGIIAASHAPARVRHSVGCHPVPGPRSARATMATVERFLDDALDRPDLSIQSRS
jgi:acetyl esterase/lipase